MIVADNSALLAFILDNSSVPAFGELLDGGEELSAPDLINLEFASALRRMESKRQISAKGAAQAILEFRSLPIERHSSTNLIGDIWSLRHSFTAYDASYVALARRLDVPLVTKDGKMARGAEGLAKIVLL